LGNPGSRVLRSDPGQALNLGDGASLRVLTVSKRGAILLLEWNCFQALLRLGADPESQEILFRSYHYLSFFHAITLIPNIKQQ
jgi:hypothetical protein